MDYIDWSLAFMHERKALGKSNRIDEEWLRDFKAWKGLKIKTAYEVMNEEIYG